MDFINSGWQFLFVCFILLAVYLCGSIIRCFNGDQAFFKKQTCKWKLVSRFARKTSVAMWGMQAKEQCRELQGCICLGSSKTLRPLHVFSGLSWENSWSIWCSWMEGLVLGKEITFLALLSDGITLRNEGFGTDHLRPEQSKRGKKVFSINIFY